MPLSSWNTTTRGAFSHDPPIAHFYFAESFSRPILQALMAKMRVAQISRPGAPFEIVQREIPKPPPGHVRIKVEACGICHSDSLVKEGKWPGIQYPRVPGHEVAGVVEALGEGVVQWKPGDRVGVGWHGGHCGF